MARPSSGDRRGFLWKLPVAKTKDLGKLGPGLAFGAGCGVGVGIGFFGGAGLGPGFPGVSLGFGAGVGCGVGVGFGYGVGRGVAYDEFRRHSNVGKMSVPSGNAISDLFEDLSAFTERQLVYAIKQLEESAKELEKRLGNRKR